MSQVTTDSRRRLAPVSKNVPLGGFCGWSACDAARAPRRVTASERPANSPVFLAAERRELGERWYMQEYECVFCATVDCVFDPVAVEICFGIGVRLLRVVRGRMFRVIGDLFDRGESKQKEVRYLVVTDRVERVGLRVAQWDSPIH